MRRAGYAVYMLPTLGGSYEESPPSLIDLAARDRRWCQGNLQHTRICWRQGAGSAPRASISRPASWAISLRRCGWRNCWSASCWCCRSSYIRPEYFTADFSLFPAWPRFDYERALQLFELTIAVLLAPKFLGLIAALIDGPHARGARRRHSPHRLDAVSRSSSRPRSAPIMMVIQSGFGHADPVGPRHRLEPATARRRLDSVRQHRAPPSRRIRCLASSRCSPAC